MTLNMSKSEFDKLKAEIERRIREWWKREQGQLTKADELEPLSIWGGLPAVDSKTAIKASVDLKEILGTTLKPSVIRQGGYDSIDDFIADLIAKLRDCCSTKALPQTKRVNRLAQRGTKKSTRAGA